VGGSAFAPSDLGGSAASRALAEAPGRSTVEAHAHAVGSDANALSQAYGREANAQALAEVPVASLLPSAGIARAETRGSGLASARASQGSLFGFSVEARGSSQEQMRVEAQLHGIQDPTLPRPTDVSAFATATVAPDAATVQAALAGTAHQDMQQVLALADLALGGPDADGESILLDASLEVAAHSLLGPTLDVGFYGAESLGEGFERLMLEITRGDETLFDEDFEGVAAALAFFDGGELSLDLGPLLPGLTDHPLRIQLSAAGQTVGDGFETHLAVGHFVPEPRTLVLLLCGLVCLAGAARRSQLYF